MEDKNILLTAKIDVLVMPDGEVLCFGRSIGNIEDIVGVHEILWHKLSDVKEYRGN